MKKVDQEGFLSVSQREIFEEAKRRYPVGAVVRSLTESYESYEMKISRHDFYTWTEFGELYFYGDNYCRSVYKNGTWTEVLSYPENYVIPNPNSSNYPIF